MTILGNAWAFEPLEQTFAADVTIALPTVGPDTYDVWYAPSKGQWKVLATVDSSSVALAVTKSLGYFALAKAHLPCSADTNCTNDRICVGNVCIDNPCKDVAAGQACGTGVNANALFECGGGLIAKTTTCAIGTSCQVGLTAATAMCSQWAAQPSVPVKETETLMSACFFQDKLNVISDQGRLYAFSAVPTPTGLVGTWSEDTEFATVNASPPPGVGGGGFSWAIAKVIPGGGSDTDLYVSGPAGLLFHADAKRSWTKLATGTTANLRRIATSAAGPNLSVVIPGDKGAWVTNTAGSPTAFTATTLEADGAPITGLLMSATVPGGAFSIAGAFPANGTLGLYHTGPAMSWMLDANDAPPADQNDSVKHVVKLNNTLALAVAGTHILQADLSNPTAAVTWKVVYTAPAPLASLQPLASNSNRALAVGATGVAAARGNDGTWAASPTITDTLNVKAIAMLNASNIYAVGSQGLVMKYVGP